MAKIYIATTLSKRKDHNLLRDLLVKEGHSITYDWTTHKSFAIPNYQFGTEEAKQVSLNEVQGVLDADLLIVLLPGKKGTHVELGLALAAQKPIILHSEEEKDFSLHHHSCLFYFHPLVTRIICLLQQPKPLLHAVKQKIQLVSLI